MSEDSYMIKKILTNHRGNKQFVLMTDGYSQVLELNDIKIVMQFVDVLNENTDNGCKYEIITVKNENKT